MREINGYTLHSRQHCTRKYLLERSWRYLPWRPSTLLSACLRQAILTLSTSPSSLQQAISVAVSTFTANCARPGLDLPTGIDSYSLAMDYTGSIRTILTYLAQVSLPALKLKPALAIPDLDISWGFLSFQDDSGALHRFSFPSTLSDTSLVREGHSWELYGDLVLSSSPMTLHLISTGRRESSHLSSPWCRAYQSSLTRQLRFQKRSGESLNETWKPVYFSVDTDPAVWVEKMNRDNAITPLVRDYSISPPESARVDQFMRELSWEVGELDRLEGLEFTSVPIYRPQCDSPYVCQHQVVCYAKDPEREVRECGLYEEVKRKRGGQSS